MSGHLDMQTGKWVDDTEADDDKAFAAEQATHAKPGNSPPAGDMPSVDVGDDGLVRPSGASGGSPAPAAPGPGAVTPLSAVDRAKLMQFIQSNAGNPTEVAAARQMLAGSTVAAPPIAAPAAPQVAPALPQRTVQVGGDGLVRGMPPAPPAQMSMADKARLVQQMRNRAMLTQGGVR